MSIIPIVSSNGTICLVGAADLSPNTLINLADIVDIFVGVDGGANHLLNANITPNAVIGDMDSLSDKAQKMLCDILWKIEEQSTTDFEKALCRVCAPMILAVGFTGGRIDHTLSALNVLSRNMARAIVLLDEIDTSFVPQKSVTSFCLPAGTAVSIMPLGMAHVTVTGVRWAFTNTLMTPDGFISPSNAAIGGRVTIETDGPILVTLPRDHLSVTLKAAARAE